MSLTLRKISSKKRVSLLLSNPVLVKQITIIFFYGAIQSSEPKVPMSNYLYEAYTDLKIHFLDGAIEILGNWLPIARYLCVNESGEIE